MAAHTSSAPADAPDAVLVARVRAGDETAFAALVERHEAGLQRRCRRVLGDGGAEDAVQLTFLRALQALRAGVEVRRLEPWLYRIARNVALNEIVSRRGGAAELSEEVVDRRGVDVLERRADLRVALRALAALPGRQRDALLAAVRGESHAEIAAGLGVSEVSARQLVSRARAAVRSAVGGWLPAPLTWVARRLSAISTRLPVPPPSVEPFIPKAAVIAVAVGAIAAPTGLVVLRSHAGAHPARVATADVDLAAARAALARDVVIGLGTGTAHPPAVRWTDLAAGATSGHSRRGVGTAARPARGGTGGGRGGAGSGGGAGSRGSAGSGGGGGNSGGPHQRPVDTIALASDPSADDPTATDPSADDPTATDSTATDSTATDPAATDPTVTDPTATDPTATDPTATDPTATDPTATDPTATDPTATDPTASAAAGTDTTAADSAAPAP